MSASLIIWWLYIREYRSERVWKESKLKVKKKQAAPPPKLHRSEGGFIPTLVKKDATIGISSQRIPVVSPVHPRTMKSIDRFGLEHILNSTDNQFILTEPLGYLSFLDLVMNTKMVITDSGDIKVETTIR